MATCLQRFLELDRNFLETAGGLSVFSGNGMIGSTFGWRLTKLFLLVISSLQLAESLGSIQREQNTFRNIRKQQKRVRHFWFV
jgi:hypothetical protein